jgi:hypothetical protein
MASLSLAEAKSMEDTLSDLPMIPDGKFSPGERLNAR